MARMSIVSEIPSFAREPYSQNKLWACDLGDEPCAKTVLGHNGNFRMIGLHAYREVRARR